MRPEPDARLTGKLARSLDRRSARQGDQRREALLRALDELLHETDLESITIADIAAIDAMDTGVRGGLDPDTFDLDLGITR